MGDRVRVRVSNAISGLEMLAETSLPRREVVRHVLAALGSRPSRPAKVFQAGALVQEDFQVQSSADVSFTATIGDALATEEREELLRALHRGDTFFWKLAPEARDDKALALAAIEGDGAGRILQHTSEALRDDFDVVLASVLQPGGCAFEDASEALRGNRDLVLAALAEHPWVFARTSDALRNDKALALLAVRRNGGLLASASRNLRNDREVVLAAVQQCGPALEHASPDLQADVAIVMAAVGQCGTALQHAGPDLRADAALAMFALQRGWPYVALLNMCPAARDNKAFALTAIALDTYPRVLIFASEALRNDFDVVLASVQQSGTTFEYAGEALRGDRAILLAAVAEHPWAFARTSQALRDDEALALQAVQLDGHLLAFASGDVQKNRRVVLAAVQQCGAALRHASHDLRTDAAMVRAAAGRCGGLGGALCRCQTGRARHSSEAAQHAKKLGQAKRFRYV